jgi:hypothetical protein
MSVFLAPSSMIWTWRYRLDLYTERRGRSAVPIMRERMRAWRRVRFRVFVIDLFIYLLRGLLTLLAADHLVIVADALALVRLWLLERADVCSKLPDQLFIKTL